LEDLDTMVDAAGNIAGRSFCALGDAAATPILSSFKYFRSEFEDLVTGRTPPVVDHRQLAGAH
jgi:NADH-quinone oxidoreductase subunit F